MERYARFANQAYLNITGKVRDCAFAEFFRRGFGSRVARSGSKLQSQFRCGERLERALTVLMIASGPRLPPMTASIEEALSLR